MSQKVLLGLSGGVDSAAAAYLLKKQGYDVTCAFMRDWDSFANNDIMGNPTVQDDVCPQEQDHLGAKAVADKLGLPLLCMDFVKEYWDHVFTYFLEEYRKERIPNPDTSCNKYIKSNAFMDYARRLGFDTLTTGYYAQVDHSAEEPHMLRGADNSKDQTYSLCQISQDALRHSILPIGHMEKQEVREIAERMELNSVAEKKDPTGICFIGERNFEELLKSYLPSRDGDIMDIKTLEAAGRHSGVLYYMTGQREGFGIGGNRRLWFVVGKDVQKNILYVTNGSESDWLHSNSCTVSGVNWSSSERPQGGYVCTAKFRCRQPDNDVILCFISETTVSLHYPQTISSVTAGQEAAFYQKEECLGGGVIGDVFEEGISLQHRIAGRVNNGN